MLWINAPKKLIQSLLKACSNLAQTLLKSCSNLAQTSLKPLSNLAQTLLKPRSNLAQTLLKPCANLFQISFKSCSNLIHTLRLKRAERGLGARFERRDMKNIFWKKCHSLYSLYIGYSIVIGRYEKIDIGILLVSADKKIVFISLYRYRPIWKKAYRLLPEWDSLTAYR